MDVRLALYQLAHRHRLDAGASRQLQQLAGFEREPATLAYWLPRGLAVLGALASLLLALACLPQAPHWYDGGGARFAEFRVMPDGRALLVGLRGAALQAL
ncbi:hypothetical protein [Janthinobacterium agaricidamnosum]|uniref:Uncharacterized protein n=1 Tax=Janthinobacterium agaricidamnosum NBRC 102515 = DSM 9628 TaxID=1349767 RepID=W0V0Y3_9BURK|nr:hypothetical protein [Janthinobacterium agaricidamnosum]CDG81526.1 hypothetical protein GJA_869 [Janthinobacterium agaricidamnosum NBRC 102515 = DSM 9628]